MGGVGEMVGGYLGGRQQKKAADAAAAAERETSAASIAEQRRQFDTTRADMMPWLEAGNKGLNSLLSLYGLADTVGGGTSSINSIVANDPSYQFRLKQGQDVLERGAAAKGGLYSGNAMKELLQYGQDYGSQEYGNIASRLAGLSGVGQGTATTLGSLGQNNANTISQIYGNLGNGLANAAYQRGNAYASMYGSMGRGFDQLGRNATMAYFGGGF